jgi:hypothetical protein
MSYQPGLFPPEAPKPESASPPPSRVKTNAPSPVWLQRTSIVVMVVFCFYVGLLLFLLPWTRYWRENHYLLTWPFLGAWINTGFARGLISGMGLLDIGIGISEVVHYREHSV